MLPKGLYDALPWLYMAVGALTAALLEGDLRYMPATLFFVAGGLVFMFRWSARSPDSTTAQVSSRHRRSH